MIKTMKLMEASVSRFFIFRGLGCISILQSGEILRALEKLIVSFVTNNILFNLQNVINTPVQLTHSKKLLKTHRFLLLKWLNILNTPPKVLSLHKLHYPPPSPLSIPSLWCLVGIKKNKSQEMEPHSTYALATIRLYRTTPKVCTKLVSYPFQRPK